MITTEGKAERAVLVGLILDGQSDEEVTEYLDELEFLAKTAGIETVKSFTQRMVHPDTRSFVGKGKLFEINTYIKENNIDVIIFDDDLTPSQLRNIEKEVKKKVYDRSLLILDIFQFRAQTAQSKTQVELARLQYLLPRLTNMWTHLERQRGGTGTRGGAGEKEIETDRRRIRKKISLLEDKLRIIDKQNEVQRKNRQKMVRVALVGYTNVGKSTLMTLLSKSEVFAENKLFATLDTTVRKVVVENLPFLLSDTVGFIRKLPHQLVESFKSTLDEARESDILIHIVDISHANFEDHIQVVNKTLSDIGAADKPTILLFNKIDNYRNLDEGEFDFTANAKQNVSLIDLKKTWMANEHTECIFISAQNKININELKEQLYHMVRSVYETKYPYNHYLY
ncbi:GTPase HflX [Salibacteraceae bacterium]|nr:GTPase HflX [Crocinitomicaceae bacterium]MCH9823295.1 GTPase HflX [Bacteroidota bacterium]MDA9938301.1 GTPase HflX [Salibacteraceae bacterium]MDB9725875.1 GTPase HflX [Salibacteraceae bacterium]MDC1204149.1 GTPase HflX [Salibacteraceae bacterium]